MSNDRRFARFAWGLLAYTIAVVLWGAYVRVTLSGDGCGAHWPACNGELIVVAPSRKTLIELTHRITSGICWIGTTVLWAWAMRRFGKGHRVRRGASWALLFMTTEALVGAAIVLLRMVADNPAVARGYWMAAHLTNTFLLLAWLTWTAWWASGGGAFSLTGGGRRRNRLLLMLLGLLLVGISGAIAALGDTLFHAQSLIEGLRQDFAEGAHPFVHLRILHPLIAIAAAFYIWWVASGLRATCRWGRPFKILIVVQLIAGLINWLLLAPAWMQIVHLLLADIVWIVAVLLTAEALQDSQVDGDVVQGDAALGHLGT